MSDAAPLETLFIAGRAAARRLRKARLLVVDGPDRGKTWPMERPRMNVMASISIRPESISHW